MQRRVEDLVNHDWWLSHLWLRPLRDSDDATRFELPGPAVAIGIGAKPPTEWKNTMAPGPMLVVPLDDSD